VSRTCGAQTGHFKGLAAAQAIRPEVLVGRLQTRVGALQLRVGGLELRVSEIEMRFATLRSRYRVLQFDSRKVRVARIPT
jgi:hypothetical protein